MPRNSSNRKWHILAVIVGVLMFAGLAVAIPLVGMGIQSMRKGAEVNGKKDQVKNAKPAKGGDGGQAEETRGFGIKFLPKSGVTSPRLGTLTAHPWWRKKVSNEEIEKLIAAIGRLPINEEFLVLTTDCAFTVYPDDPPNAVSELCAVLSDNHIISFFVKTGIPMARRLPTSRSDVISMLSQALDAAHASSDRARKTGKGFSALDQFMSMGDVGDLANEPGPKLPPAPKGAFKTPE